MSKRECGYRMTAVAAILILVLAASTSIAEPGFSDWLQKDREAQKQFGRDGRTGSSDKPSKTEPARVREAPKPSPVTEKFASPPPTAPTITAEDSGWLVMVYAAGDNNLDPYAIKDVVEMQKIGSSDHLKIAVLMDRVDYGEWATARRFLVNKPANQGGKDSWDPTLSTCEDIGEVNMGDPKTLTEFVEWATATYPQPNTMLILWNHGGGWRSAVSRAVKTGMTRSSGPPPKAGISRLSRGIAWDDTNGGDFLEMREVRAALEPFPPFAVIGTDACLMGMLEVAYELRERCGYFIGSEDIEPGDGWPYDAWLPALARDPKLEPEALCKTIVKAYTKSYGGQPTTLSAVRQSDIPALAMAVDEVACRLIDHSETKAEPAISFDGLPWYTPASPDFIDLGALLERL